MNSTFIHTYPPQYWLHAYASRMEPPPYTFFCSTTSSRRPNASWLVCRASFPLKNARDYHDDLYMHGWQPLVTSMQVSEPQRGQRRPPLAPFEQGFQHTLYPVYAFTTPAHCHRALHALKENKHTREKTATASHLSRRSVVYPRHTAAGIVSTKN